MADTAVFDIDGTLVDTNYHHVLAWSRAFRQCGIAVPLWKVHRAIGMGGDMLVAQVAGDDVEEGHGDDVREAWEEEFDRVIDEIVAFDSAPRVLRAVADRGFIVVLASSGKAAHVDRFIELIGGAPDATAILTSDDVENSKPHPDLVQAAVDKAHGTSAVMVGDSIWDCEAARRVDVPTLAMKTGGFAEAELRDAGAVDVYDSLEHLHARLDDSRLRRPSS